MDSTHPDQPSLRTSFEPTMRREGLKAALASIQIQKLLYQQDLQQGPTVEAGGRADLAEARPDRPGSALAVKSPSARQAL
jgi:hypothetical protein